jgi:hypothetical protein
MSNKKDTRPSLTPLDIVYQRAFKTGHGAQVIEELKKSLRYGENLYHEGQSNGDLHYQLGRQSVINDILFILAKEER